MKKLFGVLIIGLIIIWLVPISNFYTRSIFIIFILGALLTGLIISWRLRSVRIGLLFVIIFLISGLSLPGREYDQEKLTTAFIKELLSYQGTQYVWGGEGLLGIDCSGLIRAALITASLKQGLLAANPHLIRFALSLWWHDATARQIGSGYRNLTYFISNADSLNVADYTFLQPGDLAVTTDGIHILAYIGNGTWIEADPGLAKVVLLSIPQPKNIWFCKPVQFVRLAIISNEPPKKL